MNERSSGLLGFVVMVLIQSIGLLVGGRVGDLGGAYLGFLAASAVLVAIMATLSDE